jgi:hypothetical protein
VVRRPGSARICQAGAVSEQGAASARRDDIVLEYRNSPFAPYSVQGAILMRSLTIVLAVFVACLTGSTLTSAQEGHPLKGSWLGTWGPAKTHSNDIVLVLDWDGKAITGMINPGTDNAPIKNATLNPDGWLVHFEADIKDKSGVLNYVIDGKIENLSFHNRTIVGTWKNQRESGQLKIGRQ